MVMADKELPSAADAAAAIVGPVRARLEALRAEKERLDRDLTPPHCGDGADRATNVDGLVRSAVLTEQISHLEQQVEALQRHGGPTTRTLGTSVTLDFGDGPEGFMVSPVELDGMPVISPNSPLGQALVNASVGAQVTYRSPSGKTIKAMVMELH